MFTLCGCMSFRKEFFFADRLRVHSGCDTNQNNSAPLKKEERNEFGMHFAKSEQHETERRSREINCYPVKIIIFMCPIKIIFSSVIADVCFHCS